MKHLFTLCLLLISLLAAAQQRFESADDSINQQWIERHYTKQEVMIPMRDGVRLFTAVYEPTDHSVAHPILMSRDCYGCAPYGEDRFMRFSRIGYYEYLRNGYIIVFQDVRGKNMSEGQFEDIRQYIPNKKGRQTDEASDTYDTAEWLLSHTHNNGCIGVHGISYPGFYSTMAALSQHPAIKAVSPQAPVTDWFRGDDDHHNGALCLVDMFDFEYWFQYIDTRDFWEGRIGRGGSPTDIVRRDVYTDFLEVGALRNFSAIMGDSVEMWNITMSHPNLDDYWESHTVTNYLQHIPSTKKMNPAVMVVGGLFDAEDCFGAFDTYKTIRAKSPNTPVYLVEGPWSHGAWRYQGASRLGDIDYGNDAAESVYMLQMEYPFFAYYLEGKGIKPEYGARMFDTGSLEWYNLPDGWDATSSSFSANGRTMRRTRISFQLGEGGKLCSDLTYCPKTLTRPAPFTEYVSDPSRPVPYIGTSPHGGRDASYMNADQRYASWRTDVAVFQTDELTQPITVMGTPEVDFTVSTSTTDADFVVKVIDVDEDGRQNLIRWEIMRGKYRNSLSQPEPFVPDHPTSLRFTLNDMVHTFQVGHRVMVQVQSSMFPLFDRNPQHFCDIYHCLDSDFQSAIIRIYHSGEHPSRLWLPVVE